MRWARIAINAAMLTAAIRIDAHLKADVRAIVRGDDASGRISKEFCRRTTQGFEVLIVYFELIEIELVVCRFKSIRRIARGASPARCRLFTLAHEILASETTIRVQS